MQTDRNEINKMNESYIDLLEVMKYVVNVRHFKKQPVEQYKLNTLFEAFSYGPSLANQQPWEILELSDGQVQKVVQATLDPFFTQGSENGQPWLKNAPYACVILNDVRRVEARLGRIGHHFSLEDTFSAIQNLRIYALLLGLGTSVVREFNPELLKRVLDIPHVYEPICILVVGYPQETPELPPRFKYQEIVHKGAVQS